MALTGDFAQNAVIFHALIAMLLEESARLLEPNHKPEFLINARENDGPPAPVGSIVPEGQSVATLVDSANFLHAPVSCQSR